MNPLILVLGLARFGMNWYERNVGAAVKWALITVLIATIGWEVFEWLSDVLLGTQTMGFYGEAVVRDTIVDSIMNILGIALAVIIVIFYKRKKVEKN